MTVYGEISDIEADLVAWLEVLPGVGAGHAGNNAPDDVEERLPFVRVVSLGGSDDTVTDVPVVDFDVFAATLDGAKALSATIRARLVPRTRAGSAIIDYVSTNVSPRPLPWNNSRIKRVSATYAIGRRR